jgi:hypothetical protein
MAFIGKVSKNKIESSQIRVFVWFSALIYPYYKMPLTKRLEVFLFRRLICMCGFLNQSTVESGFL